MKNGMVVVLIEAEQILITVADLILIITLLVVILLPELKKRK